MICYRQFVYVGSIYCICYRRFVYEGSICHHFSSQQCYICYRNGFTPDLHNWNIGTVLDHTWLLEWNSFFVLSFIWLIVVVQGSMPSDTDIFRSQCNSEGPPSSYSGHLLFALSGKGLVTPCVMTKHMRMV